MANIILGGSWARHYDETWFCQSYNPQLRGEEGFPDYIYKHQQPLHLWRLMSDG